MIKDSYLFLIVGFAFISDVYSGDELKKLGATQDDFWGHQITSPRISPGGNAIGYNAPSPDSKMEDVSPESLNSGAIAPEWVGLVANTARLATYKQSIGIELSKLKEALEGSYFDFTEDSEALSPRVRIDFFTKRVVETKNIEDFISENQKIKKWPGEEHKFFGSSVTSAHECHDLVKQLSNNGAIRILVGTSFLFGLYLYRKK